MSKNRFVAMVPFFSFKNVREGRMQLVFLIGINSMQGQTAMTRRRVTK